MSVPVPWNFAPLGAEIDAHYRCAGLTVTGFGAQCG